MQLPGFHRIAMKHCIIIKPKTKPAINDRLTRYFTITSQ